MKIKSVGMFLLALLATRVVMSSSDCLEPDTRVVGRWKNGNYYKGLVESLTNSLNVLFDNGNRMTYNLHSKYDVLEDRIPEKNEIKWGDPVVVHRPHSFAFQPAHIREIVGGRYMVWYKDGSYIYQTKNDIRVFNKSTVCNEPAYLGCYRDQVPRYLTVFIPTRPATVATCVDMCNAQGYSVAALRNSDLCFCGNAYNKGYQTSDKRCDMPCYDNPYEKCGGVDTFSQYWTGIVGDKPIYRPLGIQAYTKFHMDPYGFKQTYQSVIRKQSIPRFGKLPWKNILQARRAVKRPSSLSQLSPWRWNTLTSSWVRADGKQFRWIHSQPKMGFKKNYRTWSSSQSPITRNGWTWNGRAWVTASKMSTGLQRSPQPYPKAASPFAKSMYGKVTSEPTSSKLQATVQPRVTSFQSYSTWRPPSTNILRSFNNVDISKDFTPNLVLQKLADRMRTVKWSQLSNFEQAFKPSSSIPLTFRYLGCFADDYQRDLPFQYSMPASSLSVRSCVLRCRSNGFSVAGIQSSSQCFCGNTYSKYGRVRDDECMMKCGASATDVCGGILRNSIYFTGIGSAWPFNPPKTITTQNTSTHAHSTANYEPTKKVTSAQPSKLSKSEVAETARQDYVSYTKSSTQIQNKMSQKSKNKARNKINNVPKELPEKDNSGIDDFQVESIKVKVNFSELKKALQTLSPEIVRRVQKDLSRMHKKEHSNHTREKIKVELEETKQDNNEDYDENDVKRIRNEIHNKALDRLSNDNIKEILRIMKIPKFELKDENYDNNFEDAIKRIHATTKKGKERNRIKVVNGEDVAHEEIESYSRVSLDFPLKSAKKGSKKSMKEAGERRRNHEKKKPKAKTNKKSTKKKPATSTKATGTVYNEKAHPKIAKKNVKAERTKNNNLKTVTHSHPQKHGYLMTKIKGPKSPSAKSNPDVSSSKTNTVAGSDGSKEKSQGKQTNPSTTKADLSEVNRKENNVSFENKPDVEDGIKTMKAKNVALKVKEQSDAQAMKGSPTAKGESSNAEQISKDQAVSTADGGKSVEIGKPSVTKSQPLQDIASLPKMKYQNKDIDSTVALEQTGNGKDETAQSSAKGEKERQEDKQNTLNRISVNKDEDVDKSRSQSRLDDDGALYLGSAAKMNDDNVQQKKDRKSQTNPSDNKENVLMSVEKEGDENGVIYVGAAAKTLQKLKKNKETIEGQEVVTLDNESKKASRNLGVTKDNEKKQEEEVKTKEKQKVLDSEEKKKTVTQDVKVGKVASTSNIPKKKEKKKEKKVEKLMKINHDAKRDKKEQTEAHDTKTNLKTKSNAKKTAKNNDLAKNQFKSKDIKMSDKQVSPKEMEHQWTSRKKVNNGNSDNVAHLKAEKDNVAQNDKVQVPQNSLQMKSHGNQLAGSDSKPTKTNNVADVKIGGSGSDSGPNSAKSQTQFQQESKLLSFQRQNSFDGKSNAASQKYTREGTKGNNNSDKRKTENVNDLDYSGMSEADKATESKIISKLNHLLNSGSGDDNFEDVVNEFEKNKIDGIPTNGITMKTTEGSGSTSNQENNVDKSRYNNSSDANGNKMNEKIRVTPVGEDLEGNDGAAKPPSYYQKPIHLPTKDARLDSAENIASGLEDASSGEHGNRYAYFGSGVDKEELPLIRADDLKRLKQGHRSSSFESSREKPDRRNSVQAQAHSKTAEQRILNLRSSIPTPPRYKMILISKDNLTTKKKKREGQFDGKTRILKLVLGRKTSKPNARAQKIIIAKIVGKKGREKNPSKNVQKDSIFQKRKEQSSKRITLAKSSIKEKYYSDVKGIRVVKDGVAFTVSKRKSSASQHSRPLNANNPSPNGSSRNHGETTNINHAINNKLKLHHISERRMKYRKKIPKDGKTASRKVVGSDGETVDDAQYNLKDNGSRNQLIWRASHSNELNNRNLED